MNRPAFRLCAALLGCVVALQARAAIAQFFGMGSFGMGDGMSSMGTCGNCGGPCSCRGDGSVFGNQSFGQQPVYVPEDGVVVLDDPGSFGAGVAGMMSGFGPRGMGAGCLCKPPAWAHRHVVFGEFLYLRPRDAELVYAAPVDGPTTPPGNPADPGNQVGPLGMINPDYDPGFRLGFAWAMNDCTSVLVTWTHLETSTSDHLFAEPGNFVQSQVTHPGVLNAADNWQVAEANYDIDYELLDFDYRTLVTHSDLYAVNVLGGLRYGRLEQRFDSVFSINGSRSVDTGITFDGLGLKAGVDAERYIRCTGFYAYGKSTASVLAGEMRASFFQRSSFANREIDTRWEAGRIVTIVDLELGVGWRSRCDRFRLAAGYLFSAWFNTLQTDEWIDAVNANHFTNLGGEAMTFDGVVARAEYRF